MQINTLQQTLSGCVELQCHFVGITKITKKNYKEFFKRGKIIQILGSGIITHQVDNSLEDQSSRTLTLKEVEEHIGFETDATSLTNKQWKKQVFSMIEEAIHMISSMEDDGLVPYTKSKQTINEENDRAKEELENLTKDDSSKYPH